MAQRTKLRARRVRKDLTLRQVAERVGVSIPFLSQLERGRVRVSAGVAEDIAYVLECEVEELFLPSHYRVLWDTVREEV